MHGVDQYEPLLDSALLDCRLNLPGNVEVRAPRVCLEPEFFAIGFHGRRSVGVYSAELCAPDASARRVSPTPSIETRYTYCMKFGKKNQSGRFRYIMTRCRERKRPRGQTHHNIHGFDCQPKPTPSFERATRPGTGMGRSSRHRGNYSGESQLISRKLNDGIPLPAGCPMRLSAGMRAWPGSTFFPILQH